jgi:hypothetical protein
MLSPGKVIADAPSDAADAADSLCLLTALVGHGSDRLVTRFSVRFDLFVHSSGGA